MERPDYIPPFWGRGRRNRRLWSKPGSVVRWFVLAPIGGTIILALLWSGLGGLERGFIGACVLAVWVQAAIYGPRAARASRSLAPRNED